MMRPKWRTVLAAAVLVGHTAFSSPPVILGFASLSHVEDQAGHEQASRPWHPGPATTASLDDGVAYSLFMHHSSGIAMLALGLLTFCDRLLCLRRTMTTLLVGCTWLLFGMFIFINSDPEGWPIGPNGLLESLSMPTRDEWIQHKLLSLIPMLLGVYSIMSRCSPPTKAGTFAAAVVSLLGGIALLVHQHADHPHFDVVNLEHRFFALTAFLIAGGLLIEQWRAVTWKFKLYLVPFGITFLGLQLILYIE